MRGRRLAWALTLAGAMSAPAVAVAQHAPAPQHETKPQAAPHVTKPATPAVTKPAAPKPAAPKTDRGAFGNLQAAIARIQKRITASMGAGASPQTVATTMLPKPKVPTPAPKPGEAPVKPAEPAAKPAEPATKSTEPAAKPAVAAAVADDRALKPTPADSAAAATQRQPAATKPGPRIALTWRTGLAWPRELLPPETASEPISKDATPASPSAKRITLIWR